MRPGTEKIKFKVNPFKSEVQLAHLKHSFVCKLMKLTSQNRKHIFCYDYQLFQPSSVSLGIEPALLADSPVFGRVMYVTLLKHSSRFSLALISTPQSTRYASIVSKLSAALPRIYQLHHLTLSISPGSPSHFSQPVMFKLMSLVLNQFFISYGETTVNHLYC